MTGEGELVETPTPLVETETAREAGAIYQELLDIVKNRLRKIAAPPLQEEPEKPTSQEEEERRNTAQVLFDILTGSETPMASFTTTLKPIEEQPPPTTESESPEKQAPPQEEPTSTPSEKPQEQQPPEKPQPVTYTDVEIRVEISEGVPVTIVTAKDPQGKIVKFSLLELVRDMAETVGLPPHQIEVIIAQLKHEREGAQFDRNQAESLARESGFLTREFLCELFDIPTDKAKRQEMLNNPTIPDQVKKVIGEIDNLPPLPDAEQVCQVFSNAGLPKDKPLSEIINNIKIPDNLPQEQKNVLTQLIGIARESIQKEKMENQTLEQLISNHYQQLEAGEDVSVDLMEIGESLAIIRKLQQIGLEMERQTITELINNFSDKFQKWGKIGGVIILIAGLLLFWRSMGELTRGPSH